jgi:hypothetical protein
VRKSRTGHADTLFVSINGCGLPDRSKLRDKSSSQTSRQRRSPIAGPR